jgi:hypothetical protein
LRRRFSVRAAPLSPLSAATKIRPSRHSSTAAQPFGHDRPVVDGDVLYHFSYKDVLFDRESGRFVSFFEQIRCIRLHTALFCIIFHTKTLRPLAHETVLYHFSYKNSIMKLPHRHSHAVFRRRDFPATAVNGNS